VIDEGKIRSIDLSNIITTKKQKVNNHLKKLTL